MLSATINKKNNFFKNVWLSSIKSSFVTLNELILNIRRNGSETVQSGSYSRGEKSFSQLYEEVNKWLPGSFFFLSFSKKYLDICLVEEVLFRKKWKKKLKISRNLFIDDCSISYNTISNFKYNKCAASNNLSKTMPGQAEALLGLEKKSKNRNFLNLEMAIASI
jgi:hypothetical protein